MKFTTIFVAVVATALVGDALASTIKLNTGHIDPASHPSVRDVVAARDASAPSKTGLRQYLVHVGRPLSVTEQTQLNAALSTAPSSASTSPTMLSWSPWMRPPRSRYCLCRPRFELFVLASYFTLCCGPCRRTFRCLGRTGRRETGRCVVGFVDFFASPAVVLWLGRPTGPSQTRRRPGWPIE